MTRITRASAIAAFTAVAVLCSGSAITYSKDDSTQEAEAETDPEGTSRFVLPLIMDLSSYSVAIEETEVQEVSSPITLCVYNAEPQTLYVQVMSLNYRDTPTTEDDSTIRGLLYANDAVSVVGYVDGTDWAIVSIGDDDYYVCSTYLGEEQVVEEPQVTTNLSGEAGTLTKSAGIVSGPSGNETYYNLNMSYCIARMQNKGYDYDYWVREDGVKMFGPYIMVAADLSQRPLGTVLECSLGTAMVVDTGSFVSYDSTRLDVAVTW